MSGDQRFTDQSRSPCSWATSRLDLLIPVGSTDMAQRSFNDFEIPGAPSFFHCPIDRLLRGFLHRQNRGSHISPSQRIPTILFGVDR